MVAPTANPATANTTEDTVILGSLVSSVVDPNNGVLIFENFNTPAGLSFNANGSYIFDTTGTDYQSLAEGETATVVVNYGVSSSLDSTNGFGSNSLTITVVGKDDAPTFTGNTTGAVTEDALGIATGTLTIKDVDHNANLNFAPQSAVATAYGSFTINAAGQWIYQLDNSKPDVNNLNNGDTLIDTITVAAATGGTQTLTITINGTTDMAMNMAPVISAKTVKIDEGVVQTIDLSTTTVDPDGDPVTFDLFSATGLPTGVAIDNKGVVTLDTTDFSYQTLAAGETKTFNLQYSASDGKNAPSIQSFTITVTGVNDPASISNLTPDAVSVTEDLGVDANGNLTVSGTLAPGDIDNGENFFASTAPVGAAGNFGTLSLDKFGQYTYSVNNSLAAVQALGVGETHTDTFTVKTVDGTTKGITFTIKGAADAVVLPVTANDVLAVVEDAALATINLGSNDTIPQGVTPVYAFVNAPAASSGITLDAVTGLVTVDPKAADYQALIAGEQKAIELAYTISDGKGHVSAPAKLTLTVTGVNDAAVIGSPEAGKDQVTEDVAPDANGNIVVSGKLGITDADAGQAGFSADAPVGDAANLGALTLDAIGNYVYTVNNAKSAVQALAANEVHEDKFLVKSIDGTTQTVTFKVIGTNDVAKIGEPAVTVVEEDKDLNAAGNLVLTGKLDITDADAGQAAFKPGAIAGQGNVGTLTFAADGTYTYTVNNADPRVQALNNDDVLKDTFTVTSADGLTTKVLTFTIDGTNEVVLNRAPIAQADTATATEDGALVTGSVATNDSDPDQGDKLTYTLDAPVAGLTLNADGSYSFDPSVAAYQALAKGETKDVVATYKVTDQGALSATSTLTIKVTGVNDAAVIGAPAVSTLTEDVDVMGGKLMAEGKLTIADVDAGEASFQTVVTPATGTLGALTLKADGTYSYTVDNSAVQSLGKDQTKVETFTVKSLDGTAKDISFTIKGVNDAAVIGAPAVSTLTEDVDVMGGKLMAEGKLTITDVDAGEASFQTVVTPATGTLGALTLKADGTYSYTVDNSAVQSLGKDQTKVETFTVKSLDGTAKDISFTIKGVNDAAVIGAPAVSTLTEDANVMGGKLMAEGKLTIADVDAGEASFQTVVTPATGTLGALTLKADGTYSYTVDNSAVQSLGKDQTKVETFTVKSLDGTTKDISFTITGVNDAAVIGAPAVSTLTEDANVMGGKLMAEGKLTITDVDAGEASFQTVVTPATGTLGALTLKADGTYSYSVDNSAVQSLGKDQTKVETFTVKSLDGTAKDISFTINGVNDAAVIGAPAVSTLTEDANVMGGKLMAEGKLTITDVDAGEASFQTVVTPATGTLGALTLKADGTYSYSVDNSAVQSLGKDQTKVETFTVKSLDGTAKDISFTINGVNDAAVIGNPAAHDVTEDVGVNAAGKLVASGVLSIADADAGQATFLTTVKAGQGALGSLTLTADGHYTYMVSNDAVQFLRGNETRTDTFTVSSADGTSKTISFDIHGADDNKPTPETLYHNIVRKTQWLNGTTDNDVFVVHGNSRDYKSGPTQDGKDIVIWNGKNFDILKGFETLRFNDKDVHADANGRFNIQGTPAGETLYANKAGTQWIHGTAATNDVFVVGAKEAGYGYSKTQDGQGVVVWKGNDFDILYHVDVIRFSDHDVLTSSITH